MFVAAYHVPHSDSNHLIQWHEKVCGNTTKKWAATASSKWKKQVEIVWTSQKDAL